MLVFGGVHLFFHAKEYAIFACRIQKGFPPEIGRDLPIVGSHIWGYEITVCVCFILVNHSEEKNMKTHENPRIRSTVPDFKLIMWQLKIFFGHLLPLGRAI